MLCYWKFTFNYSTFNTYNRMLVTNNVCKSICNMLQYQFMLVLVPKWHGGKIPIYQGAFASLFFMWSISAFVTLLKFEQICSCGWLTFSNNFFPTSHFLLSFSFREKDGGGSYLHFITEQNMCKNIFKELLLWNHLQLCIWHLLVGFWSGIS